MFFSFITELSHFTSINITMNATNTNAKFIKKKLDLSSKPSHNPERIPDNLLPTAVERKNPPIIKAVILGGDSLETNDKPIGDKHNSPTVMTP